MQSKSGNVTHYLVDFLFAGVANSGDCLSLFNHLSELIKELGVLQADEKNEGLVVVLTFLGIELDAKLALAKMLHGKLDTLQSFTNDFLLKKKAIL